MFHYDSLRTGTTLARGPANPSLMWSYLTGSSVYASPAVSDGLVFIPSWDGTLYVIDENTGQLKWSFNTGAPIFSSPAVSTGTVFLASRNGVLYALNEQSGSVVRSPKWQRICQDGSCSCRWDALLWYGKEFRRP